MSEFVDEEEASRGSDNDSYDDDYESRESE